MLSKWHLICKVLFQYISKNNQTKKYMKKSIVLLLFTVLCCMSVFAQSTRGDELFKQAQTNLENKEYIKARYLFLHIYLKTTKQKIYYEYSKRNYRGNYRKYLPRY